jgi:hypothetical protein
MGFRTEMKTEANTTTNALAISSLTQGLPELFPKPRKVCLQKPSVSLVFLLYISTHILDQHFIRSVFDLIIPDIK